jgi:hypothetical protein
MPETGALVIIGLSEIPAAVWADMRETSPSVRRMA